MSLDHQAGGQDHADIQVTLEQSVPSETVQKKTLGFSFWLPAVEMTRLQCGILKRPRIRL